MINPGMSNNGAYLPIQPGRFDLSAMDLGKRSMTHSSTIGIDICFNETDVALNDRTYVLNPMTTPLFVISDGTCLKPITCTTSKILEFRKEKTAYDLM